MGQQDQPGVWKPLGGESAKERIGGDDDVEGHAFERGNERGNSRAAERGQSRAAERAGDDDDVEGHKVQP